MSKGRWGVPTPNGKRAAMILQRLPIPTFGGHAIQRTRVVVTSSGRISEDTLASVSRLVRAGAI